MIHTDIAALRENLALQLENNDGMIKDATAQFKKLVESGERAEILFITN